MRSANALILLSTVLLAFSCGGGARNEAMIAGDMDGAAEATKALSARSEAAIAPPTDRKIIRTGELRFEVKDLDVARAAILDQVGASSGYVEGDDRSDWGNALAMTLRVRIPAGKFDAFVTSLEGLGDLQSQSINAQDVTAQWVDVEARLNAKKEVETRYLEIMKQAKTVTEVLEVERELGNVRAEIESMEAQMKTLHDQVAMSTLSITCTKPQARSDSYTPHVAVALKEGWNNLVRVLVGALYIWPFVLIAGGALIWLLRREHRNRRAKS